MKQAEDLRAEVNCLAEPLRALKDDAAFTLRTQFKGWSIDDVLGHLHMFDTAALRSLESDAAFDAFFAPIAKRVSSGMSLLEAQYPWLDGLAGRALLARWHETALALAEAFAGADPKQRLRWVGPGMSALSSLTARQMETWAHGQEVFDALGLERHETDRIRNICHLGVNTYGWTFVNRGLPVPEPAPAVRLTAPSGAQWTWNDDSSGGSVEGSAVDFARVVAQTRNISDTDLRTIGPNAARWMEIAQCFAGPPEDPPAPGSRHIAGSGKASEGLGKAPAGS